MSDSHGPIWIVNAPALAYPDERFDGVTTIPPLNPQQPMPNDVIADAARLAASDIETVMRHWTFSTISDLPNLRALLAMLTPSAPAWQAKDEEK